MAKTLSKSGITNASVIQAGHVTQSIDALTGEEAYDVTISGSLEVQGPIGIGNNDPNAGLTIKSGAANSVIMSTVASGQSNTSTNLHRWSEDSFNNALTQYRDSSGTEQIRFRGIADGINFIAGKLNIGSNSLSIDSSLHLHVAGGISGSHIQSSGNITGSAINIESVQDISPPAPAGTQAGQLTIRGNGYGGYIALDANAMHIGQNSHLRDLVLQSDETDALTIKGSDQSVIISGSLSISGSLEGGEYNIIKKEVNTTAEYIIDVKDEIDDKRKSGSVIQLFLNSSVDSGANEVRIELPDPTIRKVGTHFKIVFRTIGSAGTNTRPILVSMKPGLINALMVRITGGLNTSSTNGIPSKSCMYTNGVTPCEAVKFPTGTAGEGDQLECYSDDNRWYLSGFVSGSNLEFIA